LRESIVELAFEEFLRDKNAKTPQDPLDRVERVARRFYERGAAHRPCASYFTDF